MTDITTRKRANGQGEDSSSLFERLVQACKTGIARLADWIAIQSVAMKLTVLAIALAIPASAWYAWTVVERQQRMQAEVQAMAPAAGSEGVWTYNKALPVQFGSGSLLGFLDKNSIDRITVVYRPILWTVSERFVLVESEGRQYAYYPSDMETRILTDKAATASWGGKLNFVPRAELDEASAEVFDRLEQRFSGAKPLAEQEAWKGQVSALLSASLTLGLLGFLWFQLGGTRKALKFIEPTQITGDIDDLLGMDDIKAEVAQIKDQYERRAEYAEYGVNKPFNVMFSGPAGTGKTKLASYLAKELNLPILFHSAVNLETGYVGGGPQTLNRIVALAKRRQRCIVFLDEAQDLFMKRGGRRKFDDDTQNMLLAVLDGVKTKSDAEVIWIVASNFNQENQQMDEAMLRRFQMKVDFRLPNRTEREQIVRHYLSQREDKVVEELNLGQFVDITEGRSPADLETIVNQAGIIAVQSGGMIDAHVLMQAAERVLVGNVNENTTKERDRDRHIIAIHEWGHFLMDFQRERLLAHGDWDKIQSDMKTIKISLKANPRSNALGFVFHKQGSNLLLTKAEMEHQVRVLLAGMANEELFFGEEGTTNGAHNDITRVTRLLHHAVGEMGMYRKTRLNFAALEQSDGKGIDADTRAIMEAQSERLFAETRSALAELMPLSEHLAGKLMEAGEMTLSQALDAIRGFEKAAAAGSAALPQGDDAFAQAA